MNEFISNKYSKSDLIFLEGYLWDEGDPKDAFEQAINLSNKTIKKSNPSV